MPDATQVAREHDPVVVLEPATATRAWGEELWLDSARPEGTARLVGSAPPLDLAAWLGADPRPLGRDVRALFGDAAPIFTKVLRTDFPPLVHVGFRRPVTRDALLFALATEQEGLRALRQGLAAGRAAFDGFQRRYAAWATAQALARWQLDDDAAVARDLAPYVTAAAAGPLAATLGALRRNRAALVDLLNEIDLRAEVGNVLLTGAGTLHAIFGLSHQIHPRDPSRAALEELHAGLAAARARGAGDAELAALVAAAPVRARRATGAAPPKNEAWLPLRLGGELRLVEPQQSSDTTYSVADFYTPFVWGEGAARFRKGDAATGLAPAQLEEYVGETTLEATPVAAFRRRPEPVALPGAAAVRLLRLVDEPATWPFFTLYLVELDGGARRPAELHASSPPGAYQAVIALEGAVTLRAAAATAAHRLAPRTAAWVGADAGPYCLTADEAARALLVAVPGAHGGAPHVHG